MEEIFSALNAGGDIALIAIAIAIYRLDRRVYRLEIMQKEKKSC